MFKRWIKKLIRQDLTQNKTVLLVGLRGVGKTTLAKMIGVENSTYHTFDEVDLLVEKEDELLLYEIKMSKSISRKFSRNIKKFEATPLKPYSNLQKYIIYQGEVFTEDEGVKYIPILSWYGLI